ncbi:MAG: hypothetical protein ACXWQO_07940 [Bdellovibrionota bacterium]
MSKTFKTPKGTELPLLNLRGKDYLEVKYRLVWFREEKPSWAIKTEAVKLLEDESVFKATVLDDMGRIVSESHKREDSKGFPDHMEKAETGAIGRALALLGYGTQFAPELEEGERIVDSPVASRPALKEAPPATAGNGYKGMAPLTPIHGTDHGSYVINMGKKYKGMRLDKIDIYELNDFGRWLSDQSDLKGIGAETLARITAFLDSRDKSKAAK